MTKVDILLAVCNGEKYLEEQILSLLDQTHKNVKILVSDDASTDNSRSILESFALKYPHKFELYFQNERLGVKQNFSKLMEKSTAPYIMLSDQDDIWLHNKVEKSLHCLLEMEMQEKNAVPLLVHSDLYVVDEHLKVMHPSFWKYTNIKPKKTRSLNAFLSQNVVTGCTVMVNRLLIEAARPIPEESFMHDWWLGLVAAAFGKIGIVEEPLIYYRQHSKNTLGAIKFGSIENIRRNFLKLIKQEVRKYTQATSFYHRYHEMLEKEQKELLKAFIDMQQASWHKKRYTIYRHRFFKQGFLRNMAEFILG